MPRSPKYLKGQRSFLDEPAPSSKKPNSLLSSKNADGGSPPSSSLQKAIYRRVKNTDDNLAITSVAGSGKSTTLVGCAKRLRKKGFRVIALAFNKIIAEELQKKMGSNGEAKTLHSFGYELCRSIFGSVQFSPTSNPHFDRIKNLVETGRAPNPAGWHYYGSAQAITGLIDQIRNGLEIETPAFSNSGKMIPPELVEYAHQYVADWNLELTALREAREGVTIDYTDMVYAAAIPLPESLGTYRKTVFLVDEAQDLNPYQLMLLEKLKPLRIVFFGDPYQSIYAWRGAMTSAWQACIETFHCDEMPLSVSWRCCKTVVDLAKKYVPHIEAAPNAPTGEHADKTVEEMLEQANPDDLILCRNNAPIIKLCVQDMLVGRASRVVGKDIKGMLMGIGRDIVGIDLESTVANLSMKKQKLIEQNPNSYYVDLLEAVQAILGAIEVKFDDHYADDKNWQPPTGPKEVLKWYVAELDYLFREPTSACITYRTIHKAKGDEAGTVWHYQPNLIPSKYANTDEKLQQEDNLAYVAITRAKERLYHVF